MSMLDHFGLLAPFYDRLIKPKAPEYLWDLLRLPTDGLILDAGGGTGRASQSLMQKAAGVVLADLSHDMLMQAAGKGEFNRVCTPTERMPFSDGKFSRVLMVDALHHVCNQSQTIMELWRVLKPGGYLLIEEPDLRTFGVKLIAIAEKLALMRSHFLAPADIAGLIDDPKAEVQIVADPDGFNAWVIVRKTFG